MSAYTFLQRLDHNASARSLSPEAITLPAPEVQETLRVSVGGTDSLPGERDCGQAS